MLYTVSSLKKITTFLTGLGIIPFILLCDRIYQKNYFQIDTWFLFVLGDRTNNLLNFFFKAVYGISGVYITAGIVATALGILIWRRYWQEAATLAVATLGILILVDEILKPFFGRRRPPKPRLVEDLSRDSFPSGHAAGNFVLYFYLSFIIAARYPKLRIYVYGLATIIVILIGFASIYTKAHWLTDVLAGYVFGYIWLIVSLNLLKFLQRQ